MKDCVFCNMPQDKKIYCGKYFYVIEDINPVTEGHCLVISKRHYETIFDLPLSYSRELIEIIKKQGQRLIKKGLAEGIKLVQNNYKASGQVVNHFHLHIIPEKLGINGKNMSK